MSSKELHRRQLARRSGTKVLRPPFDLALDGTPCPLLTRKLARIGETALAIEYYMIAEKVERREAEKKVAEDIIKVYLEASIPTVNPFKVRQKVEWVSNLVKKRRMDLVIDIRFNRERVMGKRRKKSKNGKVKMKFIDVKDELFRVAKEIPELEKEFYQDQEHERKLDIGIQLGDIDWEEEGRKRKEMELENRKQEFKLRRDRLASKENKRKESAKEKVVIEELGSEEDSKDDDDEKTVKRQRITRKEIEKMKPVFEEAERWNLTEQGTASMINVMNSFAGKITIEDQSRVLTPPTVHKIKRRLREEKVEERKGKCPLAAGVDERKDITKMIVGEGVKGSKRFKFGREEHATVIFWPGETYEGHLVPENGTGRGLASSFRDFLLDRKTTLGRLRALLCDGTSKITGCWTGFMAELERLVSQELGELHPLQHIVCMLHHVEKLFEKIFYYYDGVTAGPDVFTGPIGTLLTKRIVHTRPLVKFRTFQNPELLQLIRALPSEVFKGLNRDHQQLIRLLEGLLTGEISQQWAEMGIGNVCSAR